MGLDRNTVDRAAAEHVRQLRAAGARLTEADRRAIRRLHERIAEKAARRRRERTR